MPPFFVAFCLTLRAAEPGQPPWDLHLALGGYGRMRPIYLHLDAREALPGANATLPPPPGTALAPMRSFLQQCR